jgi:hypothetical protein
MSSIYSVVWVFCLTFDIFHKTLYDILGVFMYRACFFAIHIICMLNTMDKNEKDEKRFFAICFTCIILNVINNSRLTTVKSLS